MGFEYQRTTDHSSKDRHSIHGRYTLSKAKSMNKTVLCTVLEFWWNYSPAMSLHLASVLRLLSEWTSGIMYLLRGMRDEDRRMSWSPWAASLAYAWGGGGGRTKRPSHKQSGGLGLVPTVVFWHRKALWYPRACTWAHTRMPERKRKIKAIKVIYYFRTSTGAVSGWHEGNFQVLLWDMKKTSRVRRLCLLGDPGHAKQHRRQSNRKTTPLSNSVERKGDSLFVLTGV